MNDELTHWGIKGMRWGVRRRKKDSRSRTSSNKEAARKGKISVGKVLGIIGGVGLATATVAGLVKVGKELFDLADVAINAGYETVKLGSDI